MPAPPPLPVPFPSQVLPSRRQRLSTSIPSPVFAAAVQPVTALPVAAIIPSPVFPLALQLLTVLDAPVAIPTTRLPCAVELVMSDRAGPAIPPPLLVWALQSITVRLFTPPGAMPAPLLPNARLDLIVQAVPSPNPCLPFKLLTHPVTNTSLLTAMPTPVFW